MRCTGQGSIRERSAGHWQIRQPYGRDPITGKYQTASRTVIGTKTQAKQALDDLRRELENGLSFDAQRTTFAAFASEFQARKVEQGAINRKDMVRDARLVTLLSEQIGTVLITDLDAGICERALARIHKEHADLGNNYRRMIFAKLKQILADAVMHDLLMRNPCDKLKPPKKTETTRVSFTPAELGRLMAALDGEGDGSAPAMAIRLAAVTGMRHGEILALDWGAVELDACRLRVVASLTIYNELKSPKSNAGTRTLALDDDTVARMNAYKTEQAAALNSWGIEQADSTPVITSETGTRYDYANLSRWVRRFFDAHGLDGHVLHELRHTQATFLLAHNTPLKTVQQRLGHATAALTLDLYGHAMPETDRDAANTISKLIADVSKQTVKAASKNHSGQIQDKQLKQS